MENGYERRSILPEYLVDGIGITYVFADGMQELISIEEKESFHVLREQLKNDVEIIV